MNASIRYRGQPCKCGSGRPQEPIIVNGVISCFACAECAEMKMIVYDPRLLSDPNFFVLPTKPNKGGENG